MAAPIIDEKMLFFWYRYKLILVYPFHLDITIIRDKYSHRRFNRIFYRIPVYIVRYSSTSYRTRKIICQLEKFTEEFNVRLYLTFYLSSRYIAFEVEHD